MADRQQPLLLGHCCSEKVAECWSHESWAWGKHKERKLKLPFAGRLGCFV